MIYLRKAAESDIMKLYGSLNKKYVEKNLENSAEVESRYINWYKTLIKSDSCVLLIIENEKREFLGHIKYQFLPDENEIFVFILEKYRNTGIGSKAINNSFVYIDSNKPVVAKILKENENSRRLFKKLGFVYGKREKEFGVYKKTLTHSCHNGEYVLK